MSGSTQKNISVFFRYTVDFIVNQSLGIQLVHPQCNVQHPNPFMYNTLDAVTTPS